MSDASKAVFLSYASQDAEAAKRISESLRARGVEVWFDQNELVGGDAWDAKIRGQIKACALFVPVISANTQARREGYFRLEWKLAAQRTHTMADGTPFLLPIVIDATRDAEALVPEEFRAVQWTRLRPMGFGGLAPNDPVVEAFCTRVKKLLGAGQEALPDDPASAAKSHGEHRGATSAPAGARRRGRRRLIVAGVGLVLAAGIGMWGWGKKAEPAHADRAVSPSTTPAILEARALVAQVWALLNKTGVSSAEVRAADDLCKRAAELAANDAEVLAAWSQVDSWMVYMKIDESAARRASARTKAARAMQLAPGAFESKLAQACQWVRGRGDRGVPDNVGETESALRELLNERPNEPRALLALGILQRNAGQAADAMMTFERLAQNPSWAAQAWNEIGWMEYTRGEARAAERAVEKSIGQQPYWANLMLKVWIALLWQGDLDLAKATFDRLPRSFLQEDMGMNFALSVHWFRRDAVAGLKVLDEIPDEWLTGYNSGPKAAMRARAYALDGKPEAARLAWADALRQIEQRLAANPGTPELLQWKGLALAGLGDLAEAEKLLRLAREMRTVPDLTGEIFDLLALRRWDDAVERLEQSSSRGPNARGPNARSYWAALTIEPSFDPLRTLPRFQALVARLRADSRYSPKADEPMSAAGAPMPAQKSVAVLAFANLSDDKANEYFSDGISEELLNVLAKIPGLKVSARTSAFYFKGREVPIPEIARQLGVAYLVEGSVRKAGDKVRISAQLIKAADGFPVWSETFARDLKDIFAVQDEIAGLIAKNLELRMGITTARSEIDLGAYQEYLAGRAAAAKGSMADLHEAVAHLERAVAAAPTFTAAWVQLASVHTRLGRWGGAPTSQAWPAARAAIARAQRLEPDSPEVLLALGWVRRTADWDWRGAEQAFRRALQLQPNQPDALTGAAVLLFNIGQTEEAFRLGQRAAQLDPLNAATQIDLCLMFFFNKNWVESERSARRALQLAPNGYYHGTLSWSLTRQQRYAEAEAEVRLERDEIERANAWAVLAIARGQKRVLEESRAQLEAVVRHRGADVADLQQSIAWIEANLGNKDAAFAALEKARASRDPSMAWLRNVDYLAPLFSDPRWTALLRAMGLADDQLK